MLVGLVDAEHDLPVRAALPIRRERPIFPVASPSVRADSRENTLR